MGQPGRDPFRVCALCRHFRVLEVGREFPQIADSAYIRFRCELSSEAKREDYLMTPDPMAEYLADSGSGADCPYWEAIEPQ